MAKLEAGLLKETISWYWLNRIYPISVFSKRFLNGLLIAEVDPAFLHCGVVGSLCLAICILLTHLQCCVYQLLSVRSVPFLGDYCIILVQKTHKAAVLYKFNIILGEIG